MFMIKIKIMGHVAYFRSLCDNYSVMGCLVPGVKNFGHRMFHGISKGVFGY
jgi:hypothetical protein